jgi:hypothetical protein
MGAQLCNQSEPERTGFRASYLDYVFGEDPKEGKIIH